MEVLFLSMFRGREDVYARRFYNKKKESSGYAPVCKNEWCDGICNKKAYRCNECPNRELSPLTADVAKAHLMGKDYLGRDVTAIYPMLENGTMQLLTRVLCGMETLTFWHTVERIPECCVLRMPTLQETYWSWSTVAKPN